MLTHKCLCTIPPLVSLFGAMTDGRLPLPGLSRSERTWYLESRQWSARQCVSSYIAASAFALGSYPNRMYVSFQGPVSKV